MIGAFLHPLSRTMCVLVHHLFNLHCKRIISGLDTFSAVLRIWRKSWGSSFRPPSVRPRDDPVHLCSLEQRKDSMSGIFEQRIRVKKKFECRSSLPWVHFSQLSEWLTIMPSERSWRCAHARWFHKLTLVSKSLKYV